MRKPVYILALCLCFATACKKAPEESEAVKTIPYWTENSPAMISIMDYVESVTAEKADTFVPEADRIAVFDFDGTLFGELFPTYFDNCLFMHRVLHDETYTAADDVREYAEAFENAAQNHEPEPDSPRSTAQMEAETFAGMSVEEYRDYVRDFMAEPAFGFENMTYGEGFYLPMVSLVEYLHDNGFKIFISSGSERAQVREVIEGTLDEWVPSENVIGSTFSLEASGQGDKQGRSYSFKADDKVLMEGNLVTKNQRPTRYSPSLMKSARRRCWCSATVPAICPWPNTRSITAAGDICCCAMTQSVITETLKSQNLFRRTVRKWA